MGRKTCVKCGIEKPIIQFNFKNKEKGRRNARCKECTRADIRAAYRKNRKHYLKYRIKRNKEIRDEVHAYLLNYLSSHSCVDCGEKEIVVLEFDHVRGEKKMAVSALVKLRYSLEIIKREIKKCEVRCRNCHARKTAHEQNHYALES